MELEPLDSHSAQLTLVGSYTVPLGLVGEAVDRFVWRGSSPRRRQARLRPLDQPCTALCVRDVMTPDPLVLHADLPLRTAALVLFHYGVSGAPVVDSAAKRLGCWT